MASRLMETADQCVQWVLAGAKPRAQFRVGTEFERLLVGPKGEVVPWTGPSGVRQLMMSLATRHGWQVVEEAGEPIALTRDGASITLEPAGQFELSGAPLPTISAMVDELRQHLDELAPLLEACGVVPLYSGINPLITPAEAPRMPKARYDIMRAWMPNVGERGLDMMHLTCTVQANLDFEDGRDAMDLLRAGYLVTPVLIALFANSPWRYGQPRQMASARAALWLDVDPARCDLGPLAFSTQATVEDYVQWALDVPMYFVQHSDPAGSPGYCAPERAGLTFRQFMRDGDRGRAAEEKDWVTHLSTLFPDVRLKRYVEIRAADCVPPAYLPSLPALCLGLLDDVQCRGELFELMKDGDASVDRAALRHAACVRGLDGQIAGLPPLRELADRCLSLADAGLERRAALFGPDEAAHAAIERLRKLCRGQIEPFWSAQARELEAGAGLRRLADVLT